MALRIPTEKMHSEQVIDFILAVIESHHRREIEKANDILESLRRLNRKALVDEWENFRMQYAYSPDDALSLFVQRVEAILDGGESPRLF